MCAEQTFPSIHTMGRKHGKRSDSRQGANHARQAAVTHRCEGRSRLASNGNEDKQGGKRVAHRLKETSKVMGKLIILGLAVFGAFALVSLYFPSMWKQGLTFEGHTIPYAIMVMGATFVVAVGLKGK
jgi:hypothetical protein